MNQGRMFCEWCGFYYEIKVCFCILKVFFKKFNLILNKFFYVFKYVKNIYIF